jgi:hypothetical protein
MLAGDGAAADGGESQNPNPHASDVPTTAHGRMLGNRGARSIVVAPAAMWRVVRDRRRQH